MLIPKYQPVQRTNVPKAEPWIDDLIGPDRKQVDDITRALQGQINADNLNAEVREFKIGNDASSWTDIKLSKVKGVVKHVMLTWWDLDDYAHLKWKVTSTNKIAVKVKFDSTPTALITVRLLIMGA